MALCIYKEKWATVKSVKSHMLKDKQELRPFIKAIYCIWRHFISFYASVWFYRPLKLTAAFRQKIAFSSLQCCQDQFLQFTASAETQHFYDGPPDHHKRHCMHSNLLFLFSSHQSTFFLFFSFPFLLFAPCPLEGPPLVLVTVALSVSQMANQYKIATGITGSS